ncbi:phosphoglycerate mutase-like protein [Cryphonectria parasitica EP155]|uniref:Phosphoglycerate mutase-like protein n=1 Tax=Cryphonectria parasitica (strain ATCC 38755 / EP155) TaxID=660469 RepID=A0A9P5CP45_CRYP1|nr:phosphoglycerate mutase-like protein [Cryphonectria parasitica EP155]KAF3766114.1 phosphoglycerate mutase-like protein [Cryphonectria parasitica EP155]
MAKPRLIILIRHGQSEGNKNRDIHQTIPDHRVKLTKDGWDQAYDAGRRLRNMLRADDTLHFFTSPYRRTRETTEGILATLTSDEDEPSPFKRNNIKVYEEPRLREQDFGNFQPCSAEMERMWQERADYGHFFYRIPNGESAADAYDRISGFNESLWRQFGEDDFASVCVLVTHGLMSRVFLMKWYHFSVEYFEDLRNINHCEFLIMNKQESGKYMLETKLRTWSELRRERALKKEKEKEKNGTPTGKDTAKLDKALAATQSPVAAPRRWGGCPNGCNHDKSFRIRSALADLVKRDATSAHPNLPAASSSPVSAKPLSAISISSSLTTHGIATPPTTNGTSTPSSNLGMRRHQARRFQSEDEDDDLCCSDAEEEASKARTPHIDVAKAREELVSSPDGTPSFISVDDRLRGMDIKCLPVHRLHARGRDFGGSYSGQNSRANSDVDSSEDERARLARRRQLSSSGKTETMAAAVAVAGLRIVTGEVQNLHLNLGGDEPTSGVSKRDQSGMGRNTMANRLGDSPTSSNDEHEHADDERERCGAQDDADDLSDIDKAEKEDRSIKGSVY